MLLLLLSLIVVPHFQKSESDGVCVCVQQQSLRVRAGKRFFSGLLSVPNLPPNGSHLPYIFLEKTQLNITQKRKEKKKKVFYVLDSIYLYRPRGKYCSNTTYCVQDFSIGKTFFKVRQNSAIIISTMIKKTEIGVC